MGKPKILEDIDNIKSTLSNNESKSNEIVINVKYPPGNLTPMKLDGTDESLLLQNIINYIRSNQKSTIFFPYSSSGVRLDQPVIINISNITLDFNGNDAKVTIARGWVFNFYPSTLQNIQDGTGRPSGFENGIDGDYRTIMYDENTRLKNICIKNVNWIDASGTTTGGRMLNFYSCDNIIIKDSKFNSYLNCIDFFMCSNIVIDNNTFVSQAYNTFLFKCKKIRITRNYFNGGTEAVGIKGAYPQTGKTIYQAFDADYLYDADAKIYNNTFANILNFGIQGGYYDNSNSDISSGTPVGVTLRDWYGEIWNLDAYSNTFKSPSVPNNINTAFRNNVNGKFQKFHDNIIYGMNVTLLSGLYIDVYNNKFIKDLTSSSGPGGTITLQGSSAGGEPVNTEHCNIYRNQIIGSTVPGILITGGNYNKIEDNKFINCTSHDIMIKNSSIQSPYTKSTSNEIRRNNIYTSTPTAYAYGVWSQIGQGDKNIISENIGFGGFYSGNANSFSDSSSVQYKNNLIRVDIPTGIIEVGTNTAYGNIGDSTVSNNVPGYAQEFGVDGIMSSSWANPMRFGQNFLWVDSSTRLRIKSTKPTSDTDGIIVGSQT